MVYAIHAGRRVMGERRADIVGIIRRDFIEEKAFRWALKNEQRSAGKWFGIIPTLA